MDFKTLSGSTVDVQTLADILNLDIRRIQQLAKEGVIPKVQRGEYELIPAIQGYLKFLRNEEGGGRTADAFAKAKSREMDSKAELTELRVRRLRGELLPVQEVQEAWEMLVETFRDRLLTMPDRIAPRLLGIMNRHDAKEIIKGDVLQCLSELSRLRHTGSKPAE